MTHPPSRNPDLKNRDLYFYATGETGASIVNNGIANFGFLFFMQILGMSPSQVGLALFVATLWDAISDPLMGFISDNTKTRIGRRHPYMIVGSFGMAVFFYMLWHVPGFIEGPTLVFWYVLIVNLLVRTCFTIFLIPFTALGFEICPEYTGRSKLQGIRFFFNMVVNFTAGAAAWPLFFKDGFKEDGTRLDGTYIASNYETMGLVLSIGILLASLLCVALTWKYAKNFHVSRKTMVSPLEFFSDFWHILKNRLVIIVFATFSLAQLGMMLTAKFQMITYVNFMEFTAGEKTIVHGSGMLAFAAFAFFLGYVVEKFDKKPTAFIGIAIASGGGLALQFLFVAGWLPENVIFPVPEWLPLIGQTGFRLEVLSFAVFQGMWWGGAGMLIPLSTSMIADLSGMDYEKTGVVRDGTYSAMYSFATKMAVSVGALITGFCLDIAGFDPASVEQDSSALKWVATLTFLSGPLFLILAGAFLQMYPINRMNVNSFTDSRSIRNG